MRLTIGARWLAAGALVLWTGTAWGQSDPSYECDNQFGECGTPQQSGGGGGGGGGSILVANTDLGDTYQYADDYDSDGVEDPYDLCPWDADPNQLDDDGDTIGTQCDNCPSTSNVDQKDLDGDMLGDLCDGDRDGDGVANSADLCADHPDPFQKDTDEDQIGDACDPDMDDDGVPNLSDNCPLVFNPTQDNGDPDHWGNACDDDDDADGIRNTWDNCPQLANAEQDDLDSDYVGDLCDPDKDGDGVMNDLDNCPAKANADQADDDRDGLGELCDDAYCFVVDGDFDNCLDPTDPFTAYSPSMAVATGEPARLRLFGNHPNQPLRYTWAIEAAPAGSHATIENPSGAANVSTPYEYHYLADRSVEFTPDKPGEYTVRVITELAFDDLVTGEPHARSEAVATLTVDGDPVGGCNTGGANPAAWWLLLPLLGLGTRRRED